MKILIKESQYVYILENLDKNKKFLTNLMGMDFNEEEPLNESTDKNKKFLTNHMGIDFTGKIEQIRSAYDVPYNFYRNGGISLNHAMSYLNAFGPMYLFELGDYEYLYQDRGNKDWFIDERGVKYIKDEFSERLGLDVLGLRFSDIINMYFNEEESINENEDRILRDKVKRRFSFIDQHVNELERDDVCEYWSKDEVEDYVDSSMSNIVHQVCEQIGSFDLYDELYRYLMDNGYQSRFRDFFIDTKNNYCSK